MAPHGLGQFYQKYTEAYGIPVLGKASHGTTRTGTVLPEVHRGLRHPCIREGPTWHHTDWDSSTISTQRLTASLY